MLFRRDRARFYSYLHRIWSKTSTKPVWLKMSERGSGSSTDPPRDARFIRRQTGVTGRAHLPI
jgi:hypothetical protein